MREYGTKVVTWRNLGKREGAEPWKVHSCSYARDGSFHTLTLVASHGELFEFHFADNDCSLEEWANQLEREKQDAEARLKKQSFRLDQIEASLLTAARALAPWIKAQADGQDL